jgi:23S rRNA pseudouridine2605 synthase
MGRKKQSRGQQSAPRPPENVWRPPRVIGLARSITKAGYATRAHADALVRAGRIRVDGELITDPASPVGPTSLILMDGQPLQQINRRYFALHKPLRVATTPSERGGRRHVKEFFPLDIPGLRPAGRLDANTSGLLLISNDALWNDLAAACSGLEKEYEIRIKGRLSEIEIGVITAGMHLPNLGHIRPTKVEIKKQDGDQTFLSLVVVEGKNRQVRRIFSSLRHDVLTLHRLRIGPIMLGGLLPGRLRPLTEAEIGAIRDTDGR